MYERRRYRRIPIGLTLAVDKLYKQDYVELNNLDLKLEVFDISKTGLGYISKEELPLSYYFNARIDLEEQVFFHTVLKIVRKKQLEEGTYLYGSEFVGLAPFLANKVDYFEKKQPYLL